MTARFGHGWPWLTPCLCAIAWIPAAAQAGATAAPACYVIEAEPVGWLRSFPNPLVLDSLPLARDRSSVAQAAPDDARRARSLDTDYSVWGSTTLFWTTHGDTLVVTRQYMALSTAWLEGVPSGERFPAHLCHRTGDVSRCDDTITLRQVDCGGADEVWDSLTAESADRDSTTTGDEP